MSAWVASVATWRRVGAAMALAWAVVPAVAAASTAPAATVDPVVAEYVASLPSYRPASQVEGTLRLWGHGSFKHDVMRGLVEHWTDTFSEHQPGVAIDYRMYGTASAVGALYSGAGDVAILGEEISPATARAFLRAKGYPHTDISIATGSVDVNYFDYAHMIFVHRDNPIAQLSLPKLRGVFGANVGRNARALRTWGDLGLDGEWAARRIQPYGWKTDVDFALFFRERVLQDDHRWHPGIREYEHALGPDGQQVDHGQRILDALAADPAGIAISNVRYARPGVKVLPLAWSDAGPFVEATPQTLVSQQYPLARIIPAIVDRPPGGELAPHVREFLRFLLSREGQQALLDRSAYLPIGKDAHAAQMEKLQ